MLWAPLSHVSDSGLRQNRSCSTLSSEGFWFCLFSLSPPHAGTACLTWSWGQKLSLVLCPWSGLCSHPFEHPRAASPPILEKGLCTRLQFDWMNEVACVSPSLFQTEVFTHPSIRSHSVLPKKKNSLQSLLYGYIKQSLQLNSHQTTWGWVPWLNLY